MEKEEPSTILSSGDFGEAKDKYMNTYLSIQQMVAKNCMKK
jgi:hypothetical protein